MDSIMTREHAKLLAYRAFVYGYPMVENYRLLYETTIINGRRMNTLYGRARLYGPDDTKVVTPNNDTAYSNARLDLGDEPLVLHVPAVESGRYYGFQIVDAFTNNADYIGPRTTGRKAGNYVLAGPNWRGGKKVPGADGVFSLGSRIVFLLGRTEIENPDDMDQAQAIINQYALKPLSAFLDSLPPRAAAPIHYLPINQSLIVTPLFFEYLNLCLTSFQAPLSSDAELMAELARIGVGPGQTFDLNALSLLVQQGLQEGLEEANRDIDTWTTSGDLVQGWKMPVVDKLYFGTTPEAYKFRATIARGFIYANSPREAVYPMAYYDHTSKHKLVGAKKYTMTFPKGGLPPIKEDGGFWSLTMYDAQTRLLCENDINRYSVGNRSGLAEDPDGSVTIYIQHETPPESEQSNWLPAPKGEFYVVLRVYYPEQQILTGEYTVPGLVPREREPR